MAVLFVAQTVSVMGFSLVFPFLPLYVADLGIATRGSVPFWAGMAYSAQAMAMFLAAPVWGAVGDRFGRKLMIQRALFGGAGILALMGFVRNAEELVLLRALQGLVTGVIPASSALVAATAPRERSGWALGLMQSSVWTGTSLGPLVGGIMADTLGYRSAFVVTGFLLLVSGFGVNRWITDEGAETLLDAAPGAMRRAWRRVLEAPAVRAVFLVKFIVRLGASMILPIAPLLVAALSVSQAYIATWAGVFTAVTSVAGILSAWFFGSLGDRIGHRRVLVGGCIASGLAYLPFARVDSVFEMMLLALPIGIANGAVMPSIGALLARAAPRGGQGTVYGIDASVNAAARAVAPLAGSAVAAAASLQVGFVATGAVFLAAGVVAALAVSEASESPPVGANEVTSS